MINLALRYGRLVSTDGRPLLRRPLPDDAGLRKKLAELHGLFATPRTPPPLSGDGIVMTCNLRYWPMVCVGVRLMRELGIATPIQVWHDGPVGNELDGLARLVDVRAVRRIHPARKCTHFQGKTYALLHCGWRRVIHLDADAYLVRDPGPIFDLVNRCRFVYWDTSRWSDANTNKRLFPAIAQWVPCIQGGHYALDCAAYWHELTCAASWTTTPTCGTTATGMRTPGGRRFPGLAPRTSAAGRLPPAGLDALRGPRRPPDHPPPHFQQAARRYAAPLLPLGTARGQGL